MVISLSTERASARKNLNQKDLTPPETSYALDCPIGIVGLPDIGSGVQSIWGKGIFARKLCMNN